MFGLSRCRQIFGPVKNQLCNLQECLVGKEFHRQPVFSSFLKNVKAFSVQAPKRIVFEGQETCLSKKEELDITRDTINLVNEEVKNGNEGRLFAVVQVCGKQFKVTAEDIIIIEGYWPPKNGDQIQLEKVLMVGGLNFSLIGRPILPQNLVSVKATVIEKDLSHTKTIFYKRKRKQYQRINFFRSHLTMLRINEVLLKGIVNEHQLTRQYERI